MTFKQSQEWQRGEAGRDIAVRWFKEQGYFVVPVDLIESGGAPSLEGWVRKVVLPDLQVARAGKIAWVEVKTKSRPVHYQKANELRHGIGQRHWNAYLEVQETTGVPASLAIVELSTKVLLFAWMALLSQHVRQHSGSTIAHGERMVYWPRDMFKQYRLRADLPNPVPPTTEHPWNQEPLPSSDQQEYFEF